MFMLVPIYLLVVEGQGFCNLKIKMKNEIKNIYVVLANRLGLFYYAYIGYLYIIMNIYIVG